MTTAPEQILSQGDQIDALSRYGYGWSEITGRARRG